MGEDTVNRWKESYKSRKRKPEMSFEGKLSYIENMLLSKANSLRISLRKQRFTCHEIKMLLEEIKTAHQHAGLPALEFQKWEKEFKDSWKDLVSFYRFIKSQEKTSSKEEKRDEKTTDEGV